MNSPSHRGNKEVSAGIIIVRCGTDGHKYLLLQHANGSHWSFSKGHLEKGETEKDAAQRELSEETNLRVEKLIPDFKGKVSYSYCRNGTKIAKVVVYFLGFVSPQARVELSSEHYDYRWLDYRDARDLLTYKNDRQLLDRAEEKLVDFRRNENAC